MPKGHRNLTIAPVRGEIDVFDLFADAYSNEQALFIAYKASKYLRRSLLLSRLTEMQG
jgi:hypothetical protein